MVRKLLDDNYLSNENNLKWFATTINAVKKLYLSNLSSNEFKILFYLLKKIDKNNCIRLVQKDIAAEIGSNKYTVSRAISKFKEMDILRKSGVKLYMFNPYFFYSTGATNISFYKNLYNKL